MSLGPHIRSALLSRGLVQVRAALRQAERLVMGLELANAAAPRDRGPRHWARQRAEAEACFVLTTGRSGTRSLAALMACSPHVEALHEPEPRLIAASYLAWTGAQTPRFWEEAVIVARDPLVLGAHKRGKLYFEAANRMTLLAPAIAAVYPRARFVHLVREPEAFIRSAVRRGYFLGHPWDHARPRPADEPDWERWSAERRAAWLWRTTHAWALSVSERLGPERVRLMRSEDLFRGDVPQAVALFRWLGLEPPPARAIAAALSARRNAQGGSMPWGRDLAWSEAERSELLGDLSPFHAALGR